MQTGAHQKVVKIFLQVDEIEKYPLCPNVLRRDLTEEVGEFGADLMKTVS